MHLRHHPVFQYSSTSWLSIKWVEPGQRRHQYQDVPSLTGCVLSLVECNYALKYNLSTYYKEMSNMYMHILATTLICL